MPYFSVGTENSADIELYYEDHGTGKPVVLIHGWPLSGASWEKQTLALLGAGYRVITYDRRGFGKSAKPTVGYNYDTMAADLDHLMRKLDLHDATIFGFSMGGGEVARYLGKYGSERVSKAGFLGAIPPYLGKAADNPEGVDLQVFGGIQAGLRADRAAFLAAFFKQFYNVDALSATEISEEYLKASWTVAMDASPTGTIACVDAWLEDFRGDLAKITVPTLVLHGDADRIVPLPVSGARTKDLVKGAKYVVLAGAPHGFGWTHAEAANQAMLEFLAS